MESIIVLPRGVEHIIKKLNENNYEAFVVGGCVRDFLIGIEPRDWDITTNALPETVKALFEKSIDVGSKYGTITVVINNQNIEVTTYRIDSRYSDYRRPDKVTFTSCLEHDLIRRDFTINSIAYHPKEGIIDPLGGIKDLEKGVIRSIGDSEKKFEEDALRMLRAIKFSARLGFIIHEDTKKAIINKNVLIKNISKERIRNELEGILLSRNPQEFLTLKETGLLAHVLPELDRYPISVLVAITSSLKKVEEEKKIRWAVLLHNEEKESADSILKALKIDNHTIKEITILLKYFTINIDPVPSEIKKLVSIIGDKMFLKLVEIKRAIGNDKADEILALYVDSKKKGECMNLKDLAINGEDLINLGIKQGEKVGRTLDILLGYVIENPGINTKEKLLGIVRSTGFRAGILD